MGAVDMLTALFTGYLDEVDEAVRKAKPGDGILDMPGGPKDDPCHDRFDAAVASAVRQIAETCEDAEAAEAVAFLLHAELMDRGVECARWMLLAVQRHAQPLVSRLTVQQARELLAWYTRQYPVFRRFPTQKELIRTLKMQAK